MARLRPIGHDDRLSIVEHLDELRTRLIVSLVVFVAATALCFWQNGTLLDVLDRPLDRSVFSHGTAKDPFSKTADYQQVLKGYLLQQSVLYREMARDEKDPALQKRLSALAAQSQHVAAATPRKQARRPVTLGVGEPFTVTLKVSAYAGLLLALPILLYQAYAFVLPAFSPREREVALPLMLAVPFLFIAGAAFGYFMVLPPAIGFLQNFNNDSFDVLLQARDYYRFAIMLLAGMGLLFQIPVGILAVTRTGIVTVRQLRRNRRYAIVICAVVAMVLPGQDPVTMLLELAPMYALYEGSILFAALMDRRAARAARNDEPALDHN